MRFSLFIERMKTAGFFLVILMISCAYFNTFYNAKNYYGEGKKLVSHDTLKVNSEFFDKAIEKATIVIVKHPNCRWVDDALFIMGSSYYFKGDYQRALEKLDFLNLNYPQSHFYDDALYYRGLSFFKQQKLAPAIISLKEAMESNQYRKKSMIALCYIYYTDGNYSALIDVAQKLLSEPLNLKEKREVYHLLGEAQFNQELYSIALDTYNSLLSITRDDKDKRNLKLKIAKIYLEVGEYEVCQEFLAGEDDDEFKNMLGDLNVRIGNIEKAKEIYIEVARNSAPNFASQAYYQLAELYKNEDSLELAITYYDSSVSKSSVGEYRADAKKQSDILKRIVSLINEAEEIDRSQFMLAELYFVDLEDPERAITQYQKVYEDFPKSKWAPKALYAHFWITKNFLKEDSIAQVLATNLISKYSNTEYATSAKKILTKDSSSSEQKEEKRQ